MRINAKTGNFEITPDEMSSIRIFGMSALRYARKGFGLPLDGYQQDGCIGSKDMVQVSIVELLKTVGIEFPGVTSHTEIDLREKDES